MEAKTFFPLFNTTIDPIGQSYALIGTIAKFAGVTLPLDPIQAGKYVADAMGVSVLDIKRYSETDCRTLARAWVAKVRGNA